MNAYVGPLMSWIGLLLALAAAVQPPPINGQENQSPVHELRTYYAHPEKLDALNARFRDHTCQLFTKHGMTNVAYWTPLNNPDSKLVYVLSYPSIEARTAAWKAFMADPAWQEARTESEKDGPLVVRVESQLLATTDFSPAEFAKADQPRVFELRVYTASPGRLDALLSRFRDHTCKLFQRHGITNLPYFTLLPDQPHADSLLVYFLSHASVEAAQASFKSFVEDPDWIAAHAASEERAGGPLTIEGGVRSIFLAPTDYSPLK